MSVMGIRAVSCVRAACRPFNVGFPLRVDRAIAGNFQQRATFASSSSSRAAITARAIVYETHGEPSDVLRTHTFSLSDPSATQVRLRVLLASCNPADTNVVQGSYPSRPSRRTTYLGLGEGEEGLFVGGNEGVAVVEALGSQAAATSGLKEGDWVSFGRAQVGTWASHMVCEASDVVRLEVGGDNESITDVMACNVMVNPATAFCMLTEFQKLQKGDIVIQNAANSAVGQYVIQIAAKQLGVETINLVRERPHLDELRSQLKNLGKGGPGTHILTYQELTARDASTSSFGKTGKDLMKALLNGRKLKLGLNAVSGRDTTDMLKYLSESASLVTYGAMSRSPLSLPASLQIFRDVTAHGFWQTRWYAQRPHDERGRLMNRLLAWMGRGELQVPPSGVVELPLEGGNGEGRGTELARRTVAASMRGFSGKKWYLRFGNPLGGKGTKDEEPPALSEGNKQ
ncbi:hypothetical protein A4X06_0g3286 [Tilletia controversa]|uniref:enoyl-[acyl-carrier-protein] reductase n=1 Tax=Tilletia controversa TaxID=13291 RepID=A0A8X7SXK8_9BASI|nr:hypothetical protein CF328_g2654 [Tilletia controversa]KAE8249325.1 hypothetical protein A4X06_0g3286 [Tilletia controversa]